MNFNFAIEQHGSQKCYLYENRKSNLEKTISIKHKNIKILSEYDDKVIQSYFIENILMNKNLYEVQEIRTLEGKNLEIFQKVFILDNKEKRYLKDTKPLNSCTEVFIDIEEELFVLQQNNKILNSYIIGTVILKKGIEEGMVVGIDRKNKLEDISGYLVDVNRLDVEVKENIFMTYMRKNEDFCIPIKIEYKEGKLIMQKLTSDVIKNLIIKFPISKYCYKLELKADIGEIEIFESDKSDERYFHWKIPHLNEFQIETKFELSMGNYNLPEKSQYEKRSFHVSFYIDFYSDAAIEVKCVKRVNGNKAETYVATKLKTIEYEVRL